MVGSVRELFEVLQARAILGSAGSSCHECDSVLSVSPFVYCSDPPRFSIAGTRRRFRYQCRPVPQLPLLYNLLSSIHIVNFSSCRFFAVCKRLEWHRSETCPTTMSCADKGGMIVDVCHNDTIIPPNPLVQQDHDNVDAAWFRATCERLGMATYAAAAWEEWHIKPTRIFAVCMGSVVCCYSTIMGTFLPGCQVDSWYPLPFLLGYGIAQMVQFGFYWRRGPRHAGTPAHYTGVASMMLCIFALIIPAIAGPVRLVPFQNRLLTTVLLSIAVWLFVLGGYTGASAPDKPPTPYKTMAVPLLKATWTTVRVMDPITDMVLVRMLLELVRWTALVNFSQQHVQQHDRLNHCAQIYASEQFKPNT